MKNYLHALLMLLLLTSCSSTQQPSTAPLGQSSALSVAVPEFMTSADTTLSWHSGLIWVDDPTGRYERNALELQKGLENEFERKGYEFVADPRDASYRVLAVAVLGDLNEHEEITSLFQLYPSLSASSQQYEKGTVLVALATGDTQEVVWRGAIKVFTDPGMTTVAERRARLQHNIQLLLSSIPAH